MAEWSIAAVLKTVEVRASGGSNPSLSARQKKKEIPNGVSFFSSILYCIPDSRLSIAIIILLNFGHYVFTRGILWTSTDAGIGTGQR